jgi:NADH-quinone oxidoreductase subunit F
MADRRTILFREPRIENLRDIAVYRKNGGYEALAQGLKLTPQAIVDEVKKSGLRGRGGAGFPTGQKWSFLPKDIKPHYLCINADESEPGTYKDRELIELDPHLLIEGTVLTAFAIESSLAYIYIRGEYVAQARILEQALAEARAAGLIGRNVLGSGFDCEVWLHRGAGAYICGEETGLLESLEGKRGMPRVKPPFPAVVGLFGKPTIINNVETIMNVPHIVSKGADWFKGFGPNERNTGTKVVSISGHVRTPRNVEIPLGAMTVRELVMGPGGGPLPGRKIKAVIPGGSSVPCLTEAELDVSFDYDSLNKVGTFLGSAGLIVLDDSTCIVAAAQNLMRFYAHESCGQCTPCREGCHWLDRLHQEILRGEARPEHLPLLLDIADNITFKTICALADGARMPAETFIKKFRSEYEHHIATGRCDVAQAMGEGA